MLYLEATPYLITQLENNPLIKNMDIEIGYMELIPFESVSSFQIHGGNSTEPGIEAINVRPLWDMGYTGKGTLVFNYDTGVWPTQPAFSERFFAKFSRIFSSALILGRG